MRKTANSFDSLVLSFENDKVSTVALEKCGVFDAFPENSSSGIEALEISFWDEDSIPANLPKGLKKLRLSFCKNLSVINGKLPATLEELHIFHCPKVLQLPTTLDETVLKRICLSECGLTSLPETLPSTVEKLFLKNCPGLGSISEGLFLSLKDLNISDCENLKTLGPINSIYLKEINIKNCAVLMELNELDCKNIETLSVNSCKNLISFPDHLPCNLSELIIHDTGIRSLPKILPDNLKKLHLTSCDYLEILPQRLPANLRDLVLWGCPKISSGPYCGGDIIVGSEKADGYLALLYNSSGEMTLSYQYYNGDLEGFESDLWFYAGTDNEEFFPEYHAEYIRSIKSAYEIAEQYSVLADR